MASPSEDRELNRKYLLNLRAPTLRKILAIEEKLGVSRIDLLTGIVEAGIPVWLAQHQREIEETRVLLGGMVIGDEEE